MTLLTGEYPGITLSDRSSRPARTHTGATSAGSARQLLSDREKSLPFHIQFCSGERLGLTLTGSGGEPTWLWRVFTQIKELAALPANWDSYGAAPLRAEAVTRCMELFPLLSDNVPSPSVVPTRDGGLQLEWHQNGIDFEVTVPPVGPISYLFVDEAADDEREWEGAPARYEQPIRETVARLLMSA